LALVGLRLTLVNVGLSAGQRLPRGQLAMRTE